MNTLAFTHTIPNELINYNVQKEEASYHLFIWHNTFSNGVVRNDTNYHNRAKDTIRPGFQ